MAMNPVEHPIGDGNHQHLGKPSAILRAIPELLRLENSQLESPPKLLLSAETSPFVHDPLILQDASEDAKPKNVYKVFWKQKLN
ncbi:60S Ribosomal Protein L8 [Manis pentadactyla]|nr:60S Ribosomal Protein L8 [Manis pentadactyla]